MSKNQPLVNPEASGGQHPKYHHHAPSGIILGVNHHQFTLSESFPDLEQSQRYIPMDTIKGTPQHSHYQNHDY